MFAFNDIHFIFGYIFLLMVATKVCPPKQAKVKASPSSVLSAPGAVADALLDALYCAACGEWVTWFRCQLSYTSLGGVTTLIQSFRLCQTLVSLV